MTTTSACTDLVSLDVLPGVTSICRITDGFKKCERVEHVALRLPPSA